MIDALGKFTNEGGEKFKKLVDREEQKECEEEYTGLDSWEKLPFPNFNQFNHGDS